MNLVEDAWGLGRIEDEQLWWVFFKDLAAQSLFFMWQHNESTVITIL